MGPAQKPGTHFVEHKFLCMFDPAPLGRSSFLKIGGPRHQVTALSLERAQNHGGRFTLRRRPKF